jgi:hypothetical protein
LLSSFVNNLAWFASPAFVWREPKGFAQRRSLRPLAQLLWRGIWLCQTAPAPRVWLLFTIYPRLDGFHRLAGQLIYRPLHLQLKFFPDE